MLSSTKQAQILLRVGLAFTLIYAAVSAWQNPTAWLGFIPEWLREIFSGEVLLRLHSIGNIVLGLWLLSGWRVFYPAVLAALFMAGIVVFNFGALDIVFRDTGLLFAALALAALDRKSAQD